MKYFSVPADFKKETIDKYAELHQRYSEARVAETYGNITVGVFLESGRSVELLPRVDMKALQEYIAYSNEKDISFNYTINATHMQNREFTEQGMLEIMNFLGKLYQAGVRSLTITLPSIIELVKSTAYDFEIKASTLCQVTNATKAAAYKRMGVDRIVCDESINRNFDTLKQIRKCFGEKMELIANAICHKNCVYRMFHYNQMTGDSINIRSDASANYYSHRCIMQRYQTLGNLLRLSWIRPEDIKYYTAIGIHYFKLQGRQAVLKGDPVRAVESYFRESYDGDLMELLDMFSPTSSFRVFVDNKKLDGFIKPFYENSYFCKDNCPQCNYCESSARSLINHEKGKDVMDSANRFYNQYDQYKQMLHSLSDKKEDPEAEKLDDIGFNLD